MKITVSVVHFHEGVHVLNSVRTSISTDGKGGAARVDEITATPVGILVRLGETHSLVPWGSVKSCPVVVVEEDGEKPRKGAKKGEEE